MSHGDTPTAQQYHERIYISFVNVSCTVFKERILLRGWAFLGNFACYLHTSFPQLQELCDSPKREKQMLA